MNSILISHSHIYYQFSEQKKILEDLFNDIARDYRFQIEKTHIQVIPGKLEGIYSWIAINYVLGRFQPNTTESGKNQSKFNLIEICVKI